MSSRRTSDDPLLLLIRADASSRIGIGHIKRCLALASAVARAGGVVVFACRRLGNVARDLVQAESFGYMAVPDDADEEGDARATLSAIEEAGADVVLVDHYGLGEPWWHTVRRRRPLAIVDDTGRDGVGAGADLVLNSNLGAQEDWYPGASRRLVGSRFALLSDAYRGLSERASRTPEAVRHVLVTVGGADPRDALPLLVRGLRDVKVEVVFDVVIGPGFDSPEETENAIAGDARFRVHGPQHSLAPLLHDADLAVSAAGSTVYELACLGVPSLLVQVADNQAGVARGAHESGAARLLGTLDAIGTEDVSAAAEALIADVSLRQRMSLAGRAIVDGRGADRVAAELAELAATPRVSLRSATLEDEQHLLRWRNDPLIRAMSVSSHEIAPEAHRAWLSGVLDDARRALLIAEIDGEPIGTVRFDHGSGSAEVSISIAPERRGQRLGAVLLRSGVRCFRERWPHDALTAQIRPENAASRRIFDACGFQHVGGRTDNGVVLEMWRLEVDA